jgi:hypothetical protein
MAMKVAPRGLPTCLRRTWGVSELVEGDEELEVLLEGGFAMEVLRRKSWVIAIPMEAKEREVRSQARNVLSTQMLASVLSCNNCLRGRLGDSGYWGMRYKDIYQVPDDP